MPQLDKVSFLSQFFWLCVFFLGFYIMALKYFLPQMSRILKYRKKRLSQSHQGVSYMQQENTTVRSSAEKLLETGFKNSNHLFKQSHIRTQDWLSQLGNDTNQIELKHSNHMYLHSLGERSLSHNLSLHGGFQDFSNTLFVSILAQKCHATSFSQFVGHDTKSIKGAKEDLSVGSQSSNHRGRSKK